MDPLEFLGDLEGGAFVVKLAKAIKVAASATVNYGKPSQVVLQLDIGQIANSRQVSVSHKLKFTEPTSTAR